MRSRKKFKMKLKHKNPRKPVTIGEALKRTYEVKRNNHKKLDSYWGYIHLPQVLVGKKIKIKVIDQRTEGRT